MANSDDEINEIIDIEARRKSRRSSIFHRKSLFDSGNPNKTYNSFFTKQFGFS